MATQVQAGWRVWARPMLCLALVIFGPLALLPTRLSVVAMSWIMLLILAAWAILMGAVIGGLAGATLPALSLVERLLKQWVAWFSKAPEELWLHWARHAHYPSLSHWFLEQAVRLGGREALFQQALVYLEGGMGVGGVADSTALFRKAAMRGHPEAAFRLAEALRTGLWSVLPDPGEAELWYQRSATLGFGPAAAWLAQAYVRGDGVAVDEAKSQPWSAVAERLRPHSPLSRSLLRHDAAPDDPLVRLTAATMARAEGMADRLVSHAAGRWALLLAGALIGVFVLIVVAAFFWAGSSGLYHLPLLMMMPPVLFLGWQAFKMRREGPRTGRDRLREAAEDGDPEACYQMGLDYRQGSPRRPKDDLTAALWFRKAAEAGHPLAMIALSEAYLGGHGVLRDPREAARWAEAARHESTSEPSVPIKSPR